jgi:hypothetical protein
MRQILHYTPKVHPHYDSTLIALQMSDEFLDKVNTSIKQQQSRKKIKEISRKLDLFVSEEVNFRLSSRGLL